MTAYYVRVSIARERLIRVEADSRHVAEDAAVSWFHDHVLPELAVPDPWEDYQPGDVLPETTNCTYGEDVAIVADASLGGVLYGYEVTQ